MAPDVGRSQPLSDNGSAVGADLRPGAAELTGVKAHGHNRVTAAPRCLLDKPFDRLLTTLSQHRRHSLQLSSEERLQACSDLRADIARSHSQTEDLTEHTLDLMVRKVVRSRDQHFALRVCQGVT